MALRRLARSQLGVTASSAMQALNARHPWSHNDYFHSWILSELPQRRRAALDVGCGRGELLAALASGFETVLATDRDERMRQIAGARCAGVANVSVRGSDLSELAGPFDLITMVAVLHHLEVGPALREIRRLLAPGGRFLVVGLSSPTTLRDHLWDLASMVTNPVIGYVTHPWPARDLRQPPPFPVAEPRLSFEEIRTEVRAVMPGAVMRHRLGFRHTIAWTKPSSA